MCQAFIATVWPPLDNYVIAIGVHLATFFLSCLMCHGELARRRPPAIFLTEYYFWLSLGGALGGMFNALAAPLLFDGVYEYPIALVLACLLRPGLFARADLVSRLGIQTHEPWQAKQLQRLIQSDGFQ